MGDSGGKKSAVLERLRDRSRPVLVFGPGPEDDRVKKQRHSWVGALPEAGIKDRDLVVVEAFGAGEGTLGGAPLAAAEAKELREALGIADGAFAVVLVGRDGGVKDRWDAPVAPHEIFGKVDGMPMREREVQARGGGSE